METASVEFRGVERHKAPTLADDGGAIESINLRPTASGLELVHDKKLLFVADRLSDGGTINTVYRHRALPENCFVVVADKRKLIVYHEEDGKLVPTTDDNERLLYFAEYDEDILSLGELNNVLVVRLANRQDFYLWYEEKYQLMPAISMPKLMSLSQDFSADMPKNVADRPFFQ
ncbi:MAG: hypothetical protein NC048_10000, partial [Bacteroides sp.]|nr:hypothetical protein [Bacteroides sp.]